MKKRNILTQLQETERMISEYKKDRYEHQQACRNLTSTIDILYRDKRRLLDELARP